MKRFCKNAIAREAQRSEQQEWTVGDDLDSNVYCGHEIVGVAHSHQQAVDFKNAHNAALTAKQEECADVMDRHEQQLSAALTAERKDARRYVTELISGLEQQLGAERKERNKAGGLAVLLSQELDEAKQELTSERQRREQAERKFQEGKEWNQISELELKNSQSLSVELLKDADKRFNEVHQQLLSALAAIEKHNEEQRQNMLPNFIEDEPDLSLLHEHVRKKQKPLVDVYKAAKELADKCPRDQCREEWIALSDALAKVKE